MKRIAALLAFLATAPAFALSAKPAPLTPQEQGEVKRIETYLNSITTAKADFVQSSPGGVTGQGQFYMSRPGRLRFEYAPPRNDFIVADGTLIYYYDSLLKQQSNTPIGSTLAGFFLNERIVLSGDITVTAYSHAGGQYRMELVQTKDPDAGKLTMVLSEAPMQLRSWEVVDAQRHVTDIELKNAQFGAPVDPGLFYYRDPPGAAPAPKKR